ncbi:CCA tRNA nucleotidyltransferase [Sphaerospermopsis aphanizomenoides BCCUSP55]|uniref:CCA tRNA nucleotidyltransferase n=1 Tax=Sphaerospermopsis aphanizomenoides TaxID=459663 RepID=UPI0019030C90|nr:CCA tRNA nucleotidyltransferase [Sphaerospermopsis aphanizomenoides]MBK1986326.1 CCA tRNA nucleotidyltransferase [Sphaerospermopsis aphanizomenoides BCCUSP55]
MNNLIVDRLDAKNWPFSLEWLPQPAYMVGGAVRDAILGRSREYLDLDFIIPDDAVKVARAIAKHYQAGFVLLDAERKIARVVFPHATADFAQQEGDSLLTDLHRRDFTINAIAYNPHTQEIIDPLQGCADIETGTLRMISPANLQDDPLRLMRAYRQAAQLSFTIEPLTQTTIRTLAAEISKVASERVRVEIGYLLASSQGTPWLTNAWQDGLLTYLFPHANRDSLLKLAAVDQAASLINKNYPQLGEELQQYVRDTVKTTWLGIAKLACLVDQNLEIAEIQLQENTYSRVEIRGVVTALRLFPQFKRTNLSLREQYFLFQDVGVAFTTTITFALADDMIIEAMSGDNPLGVYTPLINRYLNPDDLVAHPSPLVSGKEVIIALNIPASPLVGKILSEIAIAQAEGKVSTPEAAIEFAKQFVGG